MEPGGPAYNVLNEFSNFGPANHNLSLLYEIDPELDPWPYLYPYWSYCQRRIEGGWVFEEERKYVALVEGRYKMRRYQKALKLDRVKGLRRSSPVPGAWVD